MALMPLFRMGPPPRSFAADAHYCIMVPVSDPPNTRTRHEHSCATRGLPSYRHPDTAKSAGVLGTVQGQAFGGRQDAASLDRPCARRRVDVWVGTKKRLPGRTKK